MNRQKKPGRTPVFPDLALRHVVRSTIDVVTYFVFYLRQLEVGGPAIYLRHLLVSNVGSGFAIFCVGNTSVYVVLSHNTSPLELCSKKRIKWSFNA